MTQIRRSGKVIGNFNKYFTFYVLQIILIDNMRHFGILQIHQIDKC